MKWWVALLALILVVLFGSLGALYVRTFVVHRAHGIILFVANGLDISLLNEARHQAAARGQPMNIDGLDQLCILDVEGVGQPIPDEAAASTALACGHRVRNGLVGLTHDQTHLDTLIYAAQHAGRATGLVTTRQLTAPTPLAFYGRTPGRPGYELRSAAELIDTSGIDVILGGGAQYFTPANILNERGRLDGRDLTDDAAHSGYTVVRRAEELNAVPTWRTRQILGLFAPADFTFTGLREGATAQPSLADMTRLAIKCLQYNIGGYFLVVEQGLVGKAAQHNWTDLALNEIASLDAAVGVARQYAGKQSLVIVTDNYSLGALDRIGPDLEKNPDSESVTPTPAVWLSGPGGPPQTTEDRAWLKTQVDHNIFSTRPGDPLTPAPAARFARRAEVTTAPAWLGAGGFSAERFGGFLANDQVFGLLEEMF